MAKIIKVGSQNPTFTSGKAKKASHIHTQRNSNEVTNPFKFTNFEGNTLQFADVFEGFKPSFKSTHANKLRMIASSVTGTMSKIKSSIPESIANFVGRIRERASMMKHDFLERPMIKKANEVLFTPIYVKDIISNMKGGIYSRMDAISHSAIDIGSGMKTRWNGMISNISFCGRSKYANMSVAELETHFAAALAEGGINE